MQKRDYFLFLILIIDAIFLIISILNFIMFKDISETLTNFSIVLSISGLFIVYRYKFNFGCIILVAISLVISIIYFRYDFSVIITNIFVMICILYFTTKKIYFKK